MNNSDSENLIVLKIDHTIDANNSVWYRFQQDTGLQAAYTDPINPIFNSYSPQPQRTLVVGYTHLFTPNLVNQFNPGASWYSSIFQPNNYSQVLADLSHRARRGQFQRALHHHRRQRPDLHPGSQSHAVADQRQPDLDARPPQLQVRREFPPARRQRLRPGRRHCAHRDLQRSRAVHLWRGIHGTTAFPVSQKESIAVGNLDLYAMDTYRLSQRWTFIAGLRATWNTNPVNQHGLFARPAGSFLDMTHNPAQP